MIPVEVELQKGGSKLSMNNIGYHDPLYRFPFSCLCYLIGSQQDSTAEVGTVLMFEIFSIVVVPFQYGNGFHMWCMREQVKWKDCNRMVLMLEIVEILTKCGRGA